MRQEALSDGDLLDAYAEGDDGAFACLYERHDRQCFGFIRKLMGSGRDGLAEDIHQETWCSVSRNAAIFDAARAQFKTWLFTIARNKVLDHIRAEKVTSVWTPVDDCGVEQLADAGAGPMEQVMTKQLAVAVIRAVEALPLSQREAFLLFNDGELSIEEIGLATGVGTETAKSRLRYAREGVRKALAAWGATSV